MRTVWAERPPADVNQVARYANKRIEIPARGFLRLDQPLMLLLDPIHADVRFRLVLKNKIYCAFDLFGVHWNIPGPIREGIQSIRRRTGR